MTLLSKVIIVLVVYFSIIVALGRMMSYKWHVDEGERFNE